MREAFVIALILHLASAAAALGQVQTFRNDYAGFVAAAGQVSTITFDHLPDGTYSDGHVGTPITSDFNYDLQGAHFSAPIDNPFIAGNTDGFQLRADTGSLGPHTWIIASLSSPSRSVGITFPDLNTLRAFDSAGAQLASVSYTPISGQGPFFLGIVSQTPIAWITADSGDFSERISSLVFAPVPEPGTAALIGAGALFVIRRRRG